MTIRPRRGIALVVALALALLVPAGAGPARAHPHIFIKAKATLVFENGKLVGVSQEWEFDEFFSNALIEDFDKNKSKAFEAEEIAALEEEAFKTLDEFGYFTHARVAGKLAPIKAYRGFAAEIRQGKVVYRFTALLPSPADPRAGKVEIGLFDDTYYVDVEIVASGGVTLAGAGAAGCKHAIAEDRAKPLYFGAAYPRFIALDCGG
jgi:ABC-type uncharacterized transport system substrate-binding protein